MRYLTPLSAFQGINRSRRRSLLKEFALSMHDGEERRLRFHNAVKDGTRYRAQILVTDVGVVRLWAHVSGGPHCEPRQN